MSMNATNRRYEQLCASVHVPVIIRMTDEKEHPACTVSESHEGWMLTVNPAQMPEGQYACYLGYHVRTLLLPRMTLETERLRIRHFRMEDTEDCFSFLSDGEGMMMDCCAPFAAMDESYMERMLLFDQREGQLVVQMKGSGAVIGTVNIFPDESRAVDAMEIGYAIAPLHRRRGYMAEALRSLLHLLQTELHLPLVTAGVLPENTASRGLLEKLGFRQEGMRRKAAWHEGLNQPVDLLYYYRDEA